MLSCSLFTIYSSTSSRSHTVEGGFGPSPCLIRQGGVYDLATLHLDDLDTPCKRFSHQIYKFRCNFRRQESSTSRKDEANRFATASEAHWSCRHWRTQNFIFGRRVRLVWIGLDLMGRTGQTSCSSASFYVSHPCTLWAHKHVQVERKKVRSTASTNIRNRFNATNRNFELHWTYSTQRFDCLGHVCFSWGKYKNGCLL